MKPQAATKQTAKKANNVSRPVMTHLSPSEFKELEKLARKSMRSISSTVRMLVVNGLEISE